MKKKGFTLVELLAVIAILAILVIMALPAVLSMYRQSRISSFQNEVRTVYRTAQSQFLGDSTSLNSGQKILYTNASGCAPLGVDTVKTLDMTGNSEFKYYVLVNVDGKVLNVRATNGTYSYELQAENTNVPIKVEDIDVEINNNGTLDSNIESSLCLSEEGTYVSHLIDAYVTRQVTNAITPGDEVTIKGDNFYVVSSDSATTVLLAKYDLDVTTNTLVTSGQSRLQFASGNYWDDGNNNLISPYNENGASYSGNPYPYVYDSNSSLYDYVNSYANKFGKGVVGRSLSYEEATNLSESILNIDADDYWLGSVSTMNLSSLSSYNGNPKVDFLDDTFNYNLVQKLNNPEPSPYPPEPLPYPLGSSVNIVPVLWVIMNGSVSHWNCDSGFTAAIAYSSLRPVIEIPTSAL